MIALLRFMRYIWNMTVWWFIFFVIFIVGIPIITLFYMLLLNSLFHMIWLFPLFSYRSATKYSSQLRMPHFCETHIPVKALSPVAIYTLMSPKSKFSKGWFYTFLDFLYCLKSIMSWPIYKYQKPTECKWINWFHNLHVWCTQHCLNWTL